MFLARRRARARRRGSRGQSLVEFALVFPIFILLLAGMIDFGLGLFQYMTLINATRDGARLAATACTATSCTDGAIEARVRATAGLSPVSVSVTCRRATDPQTAAQFTAAKCANSGTTPVKKGDTVRVQSTYTYHMIWPLTWGREIDMGSSLQMMVE